MVVDHAFLNSLVPNTSQRFSGFVGRILASSAATHEGRTDRTGVPFFVLDTSMVRVLRSTSPQVICCSEPFRRPVVQATAIKAGSFRLVDSLAAATSLCTSSIVT